MADKLQVKGRKQRVYIRNHIAQSMLGTRQFFFIPKAEVLPGGILRVIGPKHDITEELQPYLLKRFRRSAP